MDFFARLFTTDCDSQAIEGSMRSHTSEDGETIALIEEEEYHEWAELSITEKAEVDIPLNCYIHRVPPKLRAIDPSRYEPSSVSIGPYHSDKNLLVSKARKKIYLQSLISHSQTPKSKILTIMNNKVREMQGEARSYYAEKSTLSDDKFVEMLVLDGCFILELLYRFQDQTNLGDTDVLFNTRWILGSLRKDLVLLENQIPYPVLSELFEIAPKHLKTQQPSTPMQNFSLSELLLNFFDPILPTSNIKPNIDLPDEDQRRHLLDVLRSYVLHPHPPNARAHNVQWNHTTSATNLKVGNVRFKKKDSKDGLLGVRFENGTLQIPSFYFGKSWTVLFPNMIAREQCYGENDITSYAILMDYLISTPKDVKLLRDNGIIEGAALEDDKIAEIVSSLCKEVVQENIHFDKLCSDLEDYRKKVCNITKGYVKNYFYDDAFKGVSFGITWLLLVYATLQLIYASYRQ